MKQWPSWMGTVLYILFAGNVFFVKRLVDKIDTMESTVWSMRSEMAVLRISLDNAMINTRDCCVRKAFHGQAVRKRQEPVTI